MSAHTLTREYGGKGASSWIKPACSCGWAGEARYAFEDYQRTLIQEAESDHLRTSREETK
jgi:hypothetical protein